MPFLWFGRNKKQETESKISRTSVGTIAPGTAIWPERNYENFAKEAYMKNVICYRAIDLIGKAITSVPWSFYTKDEKGKNIIDENNPNNFIFKRPNVDEGWSFFLYKLYAYKAITGNAYVEKITVDAAKRLKELWCLRPDKISVKLDENTGRINEYVYDNGRTQIKFPVDSITGESDILHLKSFHPINDIFGLAITEVASREIDTSNEATEWNMRIMQNDGRFGMVVLINGFLTDEQRDALDKSIKSLFTGSKNAGKHLLVESEAGSGGVSKIQPYAWSPKEIDWIESNREMARRICLSYGAPPQLLGIPGDNTYSNYREARLALWEDAVIPELDFIKDELSNWFTLGKQQNTQRQSFIDYNLSGVSALVYKTEMLFKAVEGAKFLTINEKRKICGYEETPGGDQLLINSTEMALTENLNETLNDSVEQTKPNVAGDEDL